MTAFLDLTEEVIDLSADPDLPVDRPAVGGVRRASKKRARKEDEDDDVHVLNVAEYVPNDPHDFSKKMNLDAYKHSVLKAIKNLDSARDKFQVALASVQKRRPEIVDVIRAIYEETVKLTPEENIDYQRYLYLQAQTRQIFAHIQNALKPALRAATGLASLYDQTAQMLRAQRNGGSGGDGGGSGGPGSAGGGGGSAGGGGSGSGGGGSGGGSGGGGGGGPVSSVPIMPISWGRLLKTACRRVNALAQEGPFLHAIADFIRTHMSSFDAYFQDVVNVDVWLANIQGEDFSVGHGVVDRREEQLRLDLDAILSSEVAPGKDGFYVAVKNMIAYGSLGPEILPSLQPPKRLV